MDIVFQCPECKGRAVVQVSEDEMEGVKARISKEGRSPTMIVTCENGHELLITLYNNGESLGVRDVVVPLRKTDRNDEKSDMSEIEWLKKSFGGG